MKMILVNTPEGQYVIPLEPVAKDRANYYSCIVDGYDKNSVEYLQEVEWGMNDGYEAIDWLLNNTDWSDWEDSAQKINDKVKVTDDDFWTNSEDFKIIEWGTI